MADALPTYTSSSPSIPSRSSAQNNDHLSGSNTTTTATATTTTNKNQSSRLLAQKCRAYLRQRISTRHAALLLLVCCLISGLIDSVAYNAWSTFISMQTGNTIFLGLGASNQPASKPYGWAKSLVSIACFFVGCVCFSHAMRAIGSKGKTRGALLLSFLLQAGLMLTAAALVQARIVPEPLLQSCPVPTMGQQGDPDFMQLLPIGLLAFQGGGQFVASRLLGFSEIPTVVLTSVYCDLAMDKKLLARKNEKRNHRVGAVVLIILGAIAGGWISRSDAGMATTMWIAAVLKLGIAGAWLFWWEEDQDET